MKNHRINCNGAKTKASLLMSTFGQKENKGIKIIHDLHRAAKNDKKDQVIVCVQIHRQTSKADLLKSRKKKCS